MTFRNVLKSTTRNVSAARHAPCTGALRALHRLPQASPLQRTPSLAAQRTRRHFATPPPQVKHSDLPIEQYHQYSDATMDRLLESLEDLIDEVADPGYEVEYGSGVLTLKLGTNGTYVINKQPPNKQIWLSSPFSGPKRYDYVLEQDDWVYSRDGRPMSDLLNQELSDAFGRKVDLDIANVSTRVF